MDIWPNMEQRTEAWFRARAGRITASNINKVFTPVRGLRSKAADDYIYELAASCINPHEVTFEGNIHTDRGEALEPEACELFVERTGLDARPVGFVTMSNCSVLGCSPDRLIYSNGVPVGGLEVKSPLGKKHAKWFDKGILPNEHKNQVHSSMVVTELPYWYFMSFCQGFEPFILKVERNFYTEKLAEAMISFAEEYAQKLKVLLPRLIRKEAA